MRVVVVAADALPMQLWGVYGAEHDLTPCLDQLADDGFVFDACLPERPELGVWQTTGLVGGTGFLDPWPIETPAPILQSLRDHQIPAHYLLCPPVSVAAPLVNGFDILVGPPFDPNRSWKDNVAGAIQTLIQHLHSVGPNALVWWELPIQTAPVTHQVEENDDEADHACCHGPVEGIIGAEIAVEKLPHLRQHQAERTVLFDQAVGELAAALDALNLNEGLALIITANSGFPLGEHGVVGRTTSLVFGDRCRVPLLIHGVECRRPGRSPSLAQAADLGPTLAELLDCPPTPVDSSRLGRSLLPLLAGKAFSPRDYAVYGLQDEWYAVQTRHWKLVLSMAGMQADGVHRLLFSQPEDRWDQRDEALSQPEVADLLELQLRRWLDADDRGCLDAVPPLPKVPVSRSS